MPRTVNMKYKYGNDTETIILQVVTSLANKEIVDCITPESRLKHDFGLDSLNMLELCVALESSLNVTISEEIGKVETVQELIDLVNGCCSNQSLVPYNIENYPIKKTKRHLRQLTLLIGLSRLLWRFKVTGLENVPEGGKYILAPNHQSHFDSLWIWSALGRKGIDFNKICCLAKQEHLSNKGSTFMLTMLGGIPVDRSGNTVPAMKRGLDCVQNGYTMLIHPEGTRTLDGRIQEFKGGAAKLAIDADVPIIPVNIDGAWDVFPPQRKLPKLFHFGRRYIIRVSFGKPILPSGKSVKDLIGRVQNAVVCLGVRKMNIGIDVDGVLADIQGYNRKHAPVFFKEKYNRDIANENLLDIRDVFQCPDDEYKAYWRKYLFRYVIFQSARKDARLFTRKLYSDEHRIFIISKRVFTCRNDLMGKIMRLLMRNWLWRNRIRYNEIVFCDNDVLDSKRTACLENNIDIMIDDETENILVIAAIAKVICFDTSYNRNCKGDSIFRALNFSETYNIINNLIL